MTARQVLSVIVVCLGLWSLVDAPALARSAERSQLGTRRTVALDVLHPLSRISAALGLDRIDRIGNDLIGHSPPAHHLTVAPTHPPTVSAANPHAATTAPAPPAALAPVRVPTAANPLRVLIVGDSLGLSFGRSLAARLDGTGLAKTTVDAREGTGLTRPDAFDWPAQIKADIVHFHPEIIVGSFGGNDDQDVQINGRFIAFGSPGWQPIYRSRVQEIAAAAHAANAHFVWSGVPVMRSSSKTARLAEVMSLARSALKGVDGALFVDNAATLADAAGHYQVALPDASGHAVIVREPDGIHDTPAGADRLAAKTIDAMKVSWHVDLTPRPTTP